MYTKSLLLYACTVQYEGDESKMKLKPSTNGETFIKICDNDMFEDKDDGMNVCVYMYVFEFVDFCMRTVSSRESFSYKC